ncbi:MAG: GNAT family N-acetyltransferase [Candidatus Hermodarchaeota archaeon]
MKSKNLVRSLLENLINSWPAQHYFFHNGWILRFNEGVTSRANSVIPLNYYGNKTTIHKDIEITESAYQNYNLPTIFMMHDFYKPSYLKNKLIENGYKEFDFTIGMGNHIKDILSLKVNKTIVYSFYNERTLEISDFLAENSARPEDQQIIIKEITQRIKIPKKCFIIAKIQDEIIGTLMGVLDQNGILYLADMVVDPNHRRKGIAISLLYKAIIEWALPKNVNFVWLQVEIVNKNAIDLYKKLGLKELYHYHYLKKELK